MDSLNYSETTDLTFDVAEVDGELGRDLGDDVAGEVAGAEGDILHQQEDRVGDLSQLAFAQVWKNILVSF